MAFRVPTQAPRRQASYSTSLQPPALEIPIPQSQQQDEESTEWVLFSPSQPPSTARTHTDSTERTPRTAGLSRLSDFGSLETATASVDIDQGDDNDDNLGDDGTELDSLDDGLHAFREPTLFRTASGRLDQSHPALLPTHDGLGTFQASSQTVQDYLWQYEQYNPRSRGDIRPRRQSSVQRQLDTVSELDDENVERERWQRIEKWRMEQSRALLMEIERETRRQRRNSRASLTSSAHNRRTSAGTMDGISEMEAMDSNTSPPETASTQQETPDADEPLWRRITRKVIRDLIGIDDSLLSVIFGESLPTVEEESSEQKHQEDKSAADSERHAPLDMDRMLMDVEADPNGADSWQGKLLQCIARELDILVHQLCEHPGAFSTYLRASEDASNEYAGIPLNRSTPRMPSKRQSRLSSTTPSDSSTNNLSSTLSPRFSPTLKDPTADAHAALWGIEEESISPSAAANRNSMETVMTPENATAEEPLSESVRLQQEHEYWERELDVMMVFRYLRTRFGQGGNSSTNTSPRRRTNSTIHTPQDPSQRAAIIRQHHPLVARAHARSQTQFQRQLHLHPQSVHTGPTGPSSPLFSRRLRRKSSSCASQSTKVSSKKTLAGIGSGSSRNYWDIGGSVGSGSVVSVGGAAGVGAWGEI
ncbi:hypothetical protein VTN00DRAFT_4677 [Thermoascus crustaceus]|uniref:uncharacterized protein n=1 Tax=Thermoascus crustaceus TaxID=5088 RepID=UPI00374269BF